MKTAITAAVGVLMMSSVIAQMNVQKPIEITLGGVWYTGDRDNADLGFLAGVDYYLGKNYNSQTMQFVGARIHFAEDGGDNLTTYGVHYGIRYGMPANAGSTGNFYFKGAIGYYNSDIDVDDDWGLGGFAAVGWELQQNFGLEAGFQLGPSVGGVDNTSFYGAVTFRL
ncbi:MAG: hypothetical protein M3R13_02265 [Armatimonadota bacterium]|nr:hypothetical protein [Armatimonadota bacterium]